MSSLVRFGGDFGNSSPGVEDGSYGGCENGDLLENSSSAPVLRKPCLSLVDGCNGDATDGPRINAVSENVVRLTMIEGNGCGACSVGIDAENGVLDSVRCNGCENTYEKFCPFVNSNGVDGFGLDVACRYGNKLLHSRGNRTEDRRGVAGLCFNVVETESQRCNLVQSSVFERTSLISSNTNKMDGSADSEENMESSIPRRGTLEDGCGVSGLCSNQNDAEIQPYNSVQRNGFENTPKDRVHVSNGFHSYAAFEESMGLLIARNAKECGIGVSRLCFDKSDMESKASQCNGYQNVLEAACSLVSNEREDRKNGFCLNVASFNGFKPTLAGRNGEEEGYVVGGLCSNECNVENHSCSSVQCNGCENASTAHPLINSCIDSMNGPDTLPLHVASESKGEPSTTMRNEIGEGCGFLELCSHEVDIENRQCNSLQDNRCDNVSATAHHLVSNSQGVDGAPNVFCCNVSFENVAEPSIIGNETKDACVVSRLCSNRSDSENHLCNSLRCDECGNTSYRLIGSNVDAADGQHGICFQVVRKSDSEPSTIGREGAEDSSGSSRCHCNERTMDNQVCRSLQCNAHNDVAEIACSLDYTVDTLDGSLAGPHFKVAIENDTDRLINVAEAGCQVGRLCSNESDIEKSSYSLESIQVGTCLTKAGPTNNDMSEVSSCNEEMPDASSPGCWIQPNGQKGNCFCTSEQISTGFKGCWEERPHVQSTASADLAAQTPCAEEKPCNSREGSQFVHCTIEESTFSQCKPLLVLDRCERVYGSSVYSSGHEENEGKIDVKPNDVLRNSGGSKSNRSTRTRKAARQCQWTTNTIRVFLNNARRKRSVSRKQVRSSIWGAMGNIMQIFKKNGDILKFDSQLAPIQIRGSKKTKGASGRGRRQKAHNNGNLSRSKAKSRASIIRVCLKAKEEKEEGKKCLETFLPEAVDSSASVQTVNGCSPESDCRVGFEIPKTSGKVECKLEGDVCGASQFLCVNQNLEKPETPPDISLHDLQHVDKDMESTVTQEASVENTLGDCLGVSSQAGPEASPSVGAVDNRISDPGSSPVSEILHVTSSVCINTSEQAVYTRRKSLSDGRVRGQNSFIMETLAKEALNDAVLAPSNPDIASVNVTSNIKCTSTKEGKRNDKVKGDKKQPPECSSVGKKLLGRAKSNKARKPRTHGPVQKVADSIDPIPSNGMVSRNVSTKHSNGGVFIVKPPLSDATELESGKGTLKVETDMGTRASSEQDVGDNASELESGQGTLKVETDMAARASSGQDVGISSSGSWMTEGLAPSAKVKGHKLPKRSNAGARKHRSRAASSAKAGKGNVRRGKKCSMSKDNDIGFPGLFVDEEKNCALAAGMESGGNDSSGLLERNSNGSAAASRNVFSSAMLPMVDDQVVKDSSHDLEARRLQPRVAWVRCDDCYKWRCISAALADEIEETNRKWTCKDNTDKAYADCLIPQEKSNAEINAELEITDASCEEDSCHPQPSSKEFEHKHSAASQKAPWIPIKSNLFLHRKRITQTIDEVMVCHCKPPSDGRLGCGEECLNRMLNIECVRGTCPCGDLCSNQQFQKRKYAKFKCFRYGKKGYGLQLQQNVSQGQFLIEYVGEVLDMQAYGARQREYAARGQKHFYFMTLNGSEVIDACIKGNLGRFINHSCDPNCRTEKWMVNGEVCIGLFAIRDIKKGEEVTFDYNYVRVFGAAAKKCVCGSSDCRGYIGGDPQNTEVIVQGDSDDEFPEPVMVHEGGESDHSMDEIIPNKSSLGITSMQHVGNYSGTINTVCKSSSGVQPIENSSQVHDNMSKHLPDIQQVEISLEMGDNVGKSTAVHHFEVSSQKEDTMCKSTPAVQQFEASLETEGAVSKSLSAVQPCEISPETANTASKPTIDSVGVKSKSSNVEDKSEISKPCPLIKSSHASRAIKKRKCNANQVMPHKPKKLIEGAANGRFEGVEEKLNELLDADGGISKRKDATRGYLKLLFVTAASGDHVHPEASHSTRDLSLILDALLKTKSRIVLVDIMNKNGLQMLHNIMKQNHKKFNKIPIIRKLLKVLEFLAHKEILTLEHINTGPPCAGMESFKESIITLTRHTDPQVQQIARSFRDKWIPRPIRKVYSDRDDCRLESQNGYCSRFSVSHRHRHDRDSRQTDAIHCVSQTMSLPAALNANGPGFNCSLLDQLGCAAPAIDSNPTDGTKKTRKRKSRWDQPGETNLDQQHPKHDEDKRTDANTNLKMQPSPMSENHAEMLNQTSESQRKSEAARQGISDDAPPGFPSPINPLVPTNVSSAGICGKLCPSEVLQLNDVCEAAVVHPQARYVSHLPVSYGMPFILMQQLGTPQQAGDGWEIAPGMPFHPFPPLPSYPRSQTNPPMQSYASNHKTQANRVGEEAQQAGVNHSDAVNPFVASDVSPPEVAANRAHNLSTVERVRLSTDGLGRRYYRQRKGNNWERCAPWVRTRNNRIFKKSVASMICVGSAGNESSGCRSSSISSSSTLFQPPQKQQQYHH